MDQQLLDIFVGTPKTYGVADAADPFDRLWTTAFYKEPLPGPLRLGKLGLDGDKPADTRYHGGEQQAALMYCIDRYPAWRNEFGLRDLNAPCFGENFSVRGLDEDSVCIGDVFRIGSARSGATVQVSQPRQPCSKLAKRNRLKDLVDRVIETGWSGWYLRVLEEGDVRAGDRIERIEHPYPQWTVKRVSAIRNGLHSRREEAAELSRCEALSPEWRQKLGGALG